MKYLNVYNTNHCKYRTSEVNNTSMNFLLATP